MCSRSQRVGQNTLLLCDPDAVNDGANSDPGSSDHWLIPLCSASGAYLGCITLADPKDATLIGAYELSRIESLAADMAVALELKIVANAVGAVGETGGRRAIGRRRSP